MLNSGGFNYNVVDEIHLTYPAGLLPKRGKHLLQESLTRKKATVMAARFTIIMLLIGFRSND